LQIKNEPRIEFAPLFTKQRKAAPVEIKEAFLDTLGLFLADPYNPFVRNHPLRDKFAGFRSIDVTDDIRAVFKEEQSGERTVITFHLLGTHDELYGKADTNS
jgi:mRNA-degrading endonuclease YafQ of YafQ-DinJ toxin-antitoxin module